MEVTKSWKLWVFFGILMLAGLGSVLFVGLSPRPVPKISLSPFESPTVLANALAMRLNDELGRANTIVFGFDGTAYHETILKQILPALKDKGINLEHVFVDRQLGWEIPNSKEIDLSQGPQEVLREAELAATQKQKILIITGSVHSSQLLQNNLVQFLVGQLKDTKILSITFSWFSRNKAEEELIPIKCKTGNDPLQTADLGCWILQSSRIQYRKKANLTGPMGLLNQVGLSDYIFLVR